MSAATFRPWIRCGRKYAASPSPFQRGRAIGRRAVVDVLTLPGAIEVPAVRSLLRCASCGDWLRRTTWGDEGALCARNGRSRRFRLRSGPPTQASVSRYRAIIEKMPGLDGGRGCFPSTKRVLRGNKSLSSDSSNPQVQRKCHYFNKPISNTF